MSESLLIAGVVCIVASIVGGGIKLLGAEVPVLNSFTRQALLFAVGAGFLLASFRVGDNKPAAPSQPPSAQSSAQASAQTPMPAPAPVPASASPSTAPVAGPPPASATDSAGPGSSARGAPCGEATALSCLPRSSSPVVFVDETAANRAAAGNIRDGLSTTQAQADAIRDGASGKASRLCGILGSNDSSPLGKHLAAIRLNNPQPADGQSTPACLTLARSFF